MDSDEFIPSDTLARFVVHGMVYVLEHEPHGSYTWREDINIYPSDAEFMNMARTQILEAVQGLFHSMGVALARMPKHPKVSPQLLLTYEGDLVNSVARAFLFRVCLKPNGVDDEAFLATLLRELMLAVASSGTRDMTGPGWRISIVASADLVLEPA